MPVGWQAKTDKIQQLIAEEQAKIDAIQPKREWRAQPLSQIPEISIPPRPQFRLPAPELPVSEDYTPPQLPNMGNIIPDMGNQTRLPVSADYQPPQLPNVSQQSTTQPTPETPLWQKGLNTFTAPFDWVSKNITEPFGAVVTSPFTSPEGLTRKPSESWLDFEKTQYDRLKPVLK